MGREGIEPLVATPLVFGQRLYRPPWGTRPNAVTRVGVEPTRHEGLSFAALPDCVPRQLVKRRPRWDLNPRSPP